MRIYGCHMIMRNLLPLCDHATTVWCKSRFFCLVRCQSCWRGRFSLVPTGDVLFDFSEGACDCYKGDLGHSSVGKEWYRQSCFKLESANCCFSNLNIFCKGSLLVCCYWSNARERVAQNWCSQDGCSWRGWWGRSNGHRLLISQGTMSVFLHRRSIKG